MQGFSVLLGGSSAVARARPTFLLKKTAKVPHLQSTSREEDNDDEVERLKSMAAKLRAEAAALEAEQAQDLADAAQRAFDKFDTNRDGEISLSELKSGLEKEFQMELPEKRVAKLMEDFDKSGDGALQLDEMVTVSQFRNKLDGLAREEKAQAMAAVKAAKDEEEVAKFLQAQLDMVNDRPPTNTDKVLSVLPYLFPLLDGIQFARFIIMENPDNILSAAVALIYALYRSVPFSGFIAFIALSSLSGNFRINRLIRFNMQQAIFLDIALFFPGLIGAVLSLIGGDVLPTSVGAVGSDIMFGVLLLTLGYCSIASLLGKTPDQIPIISEAVNSRLPTVDMFDIEGGNFVPRRRDNDEDDDKKKD